MKKTKTQRPVDLKDMPRSEIGKDALDEAAEALWNRMHPDRPYHIASSAEQYEAQCAVLDILGTTVPAMLREKAKEIRRDGGSADDVYYLKDVADDLASEYDKTAR
jgi:hypothetical protein